MSVRIAYFAAVIKFAVPFGENWPKKLDFRRMNAGVAQLVEHHLAKVRVASSSLVSRSVIKKCEVSPHFFHLSQAMVLNVCFALVVELVDTQDLKSCGQ